MQSTKDQKAILISIFVTALLGFACLVYFMPAFKQNEKATLLKFPTSAADVKSIHGVISHYTKKNMGYVVFAFC